MVARHCIFRHDYGGGYDMLRRECRHGGLIWMESILRVICFFLIATALLAGSSGCATLPGGPRPEVEAVDVRIAGIDFEGASLAFDVVVHNPYPIALRAPQFRYGLEIGGADFISSKASVHAGLPAGVSSTITLPVRISYYELLRTHPRFRKAGEVPYRLDAAAGFSVMGSSFEIPFSHGGTFPIFRPPVVTAVKVQLAEVSLREAKLVVDAEIENPNVFELGVDDLGYELELGAIRVAVSNSLSDGTPIGAGGSGRMILTGDITSSKGLIKLLMDGVSGIPSLSAHGRVWTPYGTALIAR